MTGVGGVGEQFVKQLDDFIVNSTDNIKSPLFDDIYTKTEDFIIFMI